MASNFKAKTGQFLTLYQSSDADYATATWTEVPGIRDWNGPTFTKNEIDVTTLASIGKEFLTGLPDPGSITFNGLFDDMNPVHYDIVTNLLYLPENTIWKIEFKQTGTIMYFTGSLSGAPITGGVDAAMTVSLTIRISGKPQWVQGGSLGSITWDSTLAAVAATGVVSGNVIAILAPGVGSTAAFTSLVADAATFTRSTHYSITGVPTGLTPVVTKDTSSQATLTFTGVATKTDDVSNIKLTLQDAAFDNSTANKIIGSAKPGISITFI